jgi:hypothetical protein
MWPQVRQLWLSTGPYTQVSIWPVETFSVSSALAGTTDSKSAATAAFGQPPVRIIEPTQRETRATQ